jgi:hypothetical protein
MALARARVRFALVTVGRLLLGGAALFRSLELLRSASSSNVPKLSLLFLVVGLLMLWWGAVGARALLSSDPLAKAHMQLEIDDLERRAPSGLRPLWVALALIVGIFLVWVIIAGLAGVS